MAWCIVAAATIDEHSSWTNFGILATNMFEMSLWQFASVPDPRGILILMMFEH